MIVVLDKSNRQGRVMIGNEIICSGDFQDYISLKNFMVKTLAERFDQSIEQNLGITFPYEVSGITFFSLAELENFIKSISKIKIY